MTDKDKLEFFALYLWWIVFYWAMTENLPAGVISASFTIALHEFSFPFGSINQSIVIGEFHPRPVDGWEN